MPGSHTPDSRVQSISRQPSSPCLQPVPPSQKATSDSAPTYPPCLTLLSTTFMPIPIPPTSHQLAIFPCASTIGNKLTVDSCVLLCVMGCQLELLSTPLHARHHCHFGLLKRPSGNSGGDRQIDLNRYNQRRAN